MWGRGEVTDIIEFPLPRINLPVKDKEEPIADEEGSWDALGK